MPTQKSQIEDLRYSLHREMDEIFVATTIRNFGIGLVGLFGPIFIYEYFNHDFVGSLLFYAAIFLTYVVVVPFIAKLYKSVGLKKLMALSNPILAIHLLTLILMKGEINISLLAASIITAGVAMAMYWPAYHIDMANFAEGKKRGQQVGVVNILAAVARAASPLIGGIIIVNFGFHYLFGVALLIIMSSAIPFFISEEVYENYSLDWKSSWRAIFKKENRRLTLAFNFEGAEYFMGAVIFPIFIFVTINNIETIGFVSSVTLALAIIAIYWTGWLTDNKGAKVMIRWSSIVHALAWLINSFIITLGQFLLYSTLLRMTETAIHIPFSTLIYKKAKESGDQIDEFIVWRSMALNLGKVAFCLIAAGGFYLGFTNWLWYFGLAALVTMGLRIFK